MLNLLFHTAFPPAMVLVFSFNNKPLKFQAFTAVSTKKNCLSISVLQIIKSSRENKEMPTYLLRTFLKNTNLSNSLEDIRLLLRRKKTNDEVEISVSLTGRKEQP
jgi:hypothetical protein